MMPRIAIVHDFLQSMGGAERVTLALANIFPEAPIYTLTYNDKLNSFFDKNRIRTSYLQKFSFIPAKFLLPFYPKAIESFDLDNFNVVISSSHSFAKNVITKPETIHISYIHSPMRYAWDTWHSYVGSQAKWPIVGWVVKNIIHKIRLWDRLGADRVDFFVANSKNVANRITKFYRKDSAVIYPPVDVAKIAPTPTNQGYFLILSRLSAYKRIELAVAACQSLNLPLVIIGEGEEMENLKKMATSSTKLTGWVSDEEKFEYLANARALIFPGEEDLGIVPIEAMAAGKPVLAYKKGGLLETVVDGKTGLFFDEQTVSSLEEALARFITNEQQFNWQEIRKHAEQFSYEVFENKIKQLVNDLYGKR